MLSSQEEQAERKRVLAQDLSLRQQQEERRRVFAQDQSLRRTSTFYQHALADAETPRGRYSQVTTSYVIGSTPTPATAYPAASAAHQIQLPDEPPLGFDNPALEPCSAPPVAQEAPDPTSADAPPALPLALGQRTDVGSLSSDDPTTEGLAPPSASPRAQRGGVGSSPVPLRRF